MFIRLPAVGLSLIGVVLAVAMRDTDPALLITVVLALIIVVDAALAPPPARLEVSRSGTASTRVGESASAQLTITNPTRRQVSGQIRDAWPPSTGVTPSRHALRLPGGSSQTVDEALTPTRRGTVTSHAITIRTNGPLGLAGRQRSFPTNWRIKVLPPFVSRRQIPSRVRQLRELDGRALLLVRGEGTEFDSLREYVAGDDVRAIDWRSTARLGDTVVRTWRPERDRQVVVVLDSGRGGALRVSDAPAFDAFIEAALLQSAIAQRAGDRVSVMAFDDDVRARLVGHSDRAITHTVAQTLADVEPTLHATDWTSLPTHIAAITKRPALVVILTTLSGAAASTGLFDVIPELKRSHTVIIASTQADPFDPPAEMDAEAAFNRAAYERAQIEAKNLVRSIERTGAIVVRASAEELPVAVVDTYIDLKARGRL
ncbi:DUF58 domain-containing protein [Trueperella sp.]|uniref:DUF58 domain-containing protein n=1 Tax=Trueperella sp. TaxID=2699835 RepID=UPI0037358112